jgi:hypothetical protein
VAIVVHFSYFYGNLPVPFTIATGQNPGVSGAVAITLSVLSGGLVYIFSRRRPDEQLSN